MSRRKTKPEEIRKPSGYFAKFIAMENKRNEIDTTEYYKANVSLESLIVGGEEGVGKSIRWCFISNEENLDFEKALAEERFFGWIDLIDNPRLHKCVVNLPQNQLVLLTLRFQYCKSQAEIADMMHISQQAVSKLEKSAKKEIKKFLQKGCKKP